MDYFSISWVPQISLPSLPHARDTPTHKRPQMATHTSARGGRPSSPHARRPAAPTAESARGHARRWPHTPALVEGGGARPVPGGQRCPRQSQHMAAPAAETPCRHSSAAAGVRLLARRNRARARLAASEPRPRPEVPNPRRGLDRDWLLRPRRTQQRRPARDGGGGGGPLASSCSRLRRSSSHAGPPTTGGGSGAPLVATASAEPAFYFHETRILSECEFRSRFTP